MSILTKPYMQTANAHLLPIDRNDPSLVLYLPLWYPHGDMTGNPIYSYDINRHSCSVIGAVWGSQGRTFDGDDYIDCGSDASLNITNDISVELWINPSAVENFDTLVGKYAWAAVRGFMMDFYSTKARFTVARPGNLESVATGATTISTGSWIHLVGTYDKENVRIYLNGDEDGIAANTDSIPNHSDVDLVIGARSQHDQLTEGLIGEVRVYSRALSFGEIQNNYLSTRWRYQ